LAGDALRAIGRKLLHLGTFFWRFSDTTPLCCLTVRLGKNNCFARRYGLVWFGTVDCGLRMGLSLNVCGALVSGQFEKFPLYCESLRFEFDLNTSL
jgi:hypothetical protein